MFKKIKNWFERKWLIFLEARQEIRELRADRDFWKKECMILINNDAILSQNISKLELINIENFFVQKSFSSSKKRKRTSVDLKNSAISGRNS